MEVGDHDGEWQPPAPPLDGEIPPVIITNDIEQGPNNDGSAEDVVLPVDWPGPEEGDPLEGADGPTDDPPVNPPEAPPHPDDPESNKVREVYASSIVGAHAGAQELATAIATGELKESPSPDLRTMVSEMAVAEAGEGNIAAADQKIGVLLVISRGSELANACFAGMKAGSKYADDVLHEALLGEQAGLRRRVAYERAAFPEEGVNTSAPILEATVEMCEAGGEPPEDWINTYAIDTEQAWSMTVGHYGRVAAANADQQDLQQRLEGKIAEIQDPKLFSDAFVHQQIPEVLPLVKDPERRAALIQSFSDRGSLLPATTDTLRQVVDMGLLILKDPALATTKTVGFIDSTVNWHVNELADAGPGALDQIVHMDMRWKAAYAQFDHLPAADVVDTIDTLTGGLMATQYEPGNGMTLRELGVEVQAVRYAATQNWVSAKHLIESLAPGETQGRALGSCLSEARTMEEIEQLIPTKEVLPGVSLRDYNPSLELHIQFARARVAEDMGQLHELGVACAASLTDRGDYNAKRRYAEQSFRIMAERAPAKGAALAKEILAIYRSKDVDPQLLEEMSGWLIRHGDSEEAQQAYDYIMRPRQHQEYERPALLWRLGKVLQQFGTAS